MKIIIVADTHIPNRAKTLPSRLVTDLQDADLIIHAGDWQTYDVYQLLTNYAKVEGVLGNVDQDQRLQELFPERQIMEINGFQIGIVHGHGTGQTTEKRAIASFKDVHVDCIIFGHSHIPVKKLIDNTLLFNPGSATDKRRQPFFSYGIMTIHKTLEVEHVFYESKQ